MNLKDHFPSASQSFLSCNSGTLSHTGAKNTLQPPTNAKKRHSMTRPEREMAMILEAMRRNNEIESWKFEGVTLKLADGCRFTPDFFVVIQTDTTMRDGHDFIQRVRFVETKGPFIREDSMIKFKVAREQNPWAEWQLHQRTKNGWTQIL